MNEVVNNFKGLGAVKLGIMAAVGVALIAVFALIALRVSAPGMAVMYSGLAMEDSSKIVTELEAQGIPYELRANGAEILVPSDRMLRMRMSMAEKGIPSGGNLVGYEIFDKSDTFGSSNFVMNVNAMRALEGELARTISSFKQVESARVHLVMPKRELFERDKQEPTASIAIKLKGSQELAKNEVAAITHLVAAAVPGLKVSNITLVDSVGRLLARGGNDDSSGQLASSVEEYRVAYETRMKEMVEDLVGKVVGPGRVKAQITADINFDRVVTNKETFDPEGQVIRSVQSSNEKESAQDSEGKDSVSVANQLPNSAGTSGTNAGGGGGPNSNRNTEKTDETTNYEISKTVQNHVKEGGSVNRISVAVLVDGTYTKGAKETDEPTYAPRSQEEIDRISALIKSAIGFDEKRGDKVEVVNMRFTVPDDIMEKESFLDSFKHQLEGIIQTLIIAAVAILTLLLVVRPMVQQLMRASGSTSEKLAESLASISATGAFGAPRIGADGLPEAFGGGGSGGEVDDDDTLVSIGNVKGTVRASTIKRVATLVEKNPDETLSVMRQWMTREAS